MFTKISMTGMLISILTVGGVSLAQVYGADAVTKDAVNSRSGTIRGAAYTKDGGGHTGKAGDRAMDLGMGIGYIYVADATFLNDLSKNDEMSFAMWIKKYDIASSWAFSANSPSVAGGPRAYSGHTPWGDGNIYFDTAGCCDTTTQRIAANIDTFSDYTGDATWWNTWRHYVFSKKGATKQVWIDGKLFLEGSSTAPLPTDYTELYIGAGATGAEIMHGLIDDFAIFGTALTEQNITQLKNGTAPTALPATAKLAAYWAMDDIAPDGIFTTTSPAPNSGAAAPNLIKVVHMDGTTAWDVSKVSLKVDNTAVQATVKKDGDATTLTYSPSPLFTAQSVHHAAVLYPGADGTQKSYEWDFLVGNYTKDTIKSIAGSLVGPAKYTANGGGRTGKAGDYGIDFGTSNKGKQGVYVADASFLNALAANDEMAISCWQKLYAIADSGLFWANSPSSSGTQRGFSCHTPWSNNTIYFDTAGCCDTSTQRINQGIDQFPGYSGDQSWWTNWHHFVFQKKGSTKEIWIDGQQFMTGESTSALPTDFDYLYWGYDKADDDGLTGLIDDAAIFGAALSQSDIGKLAAGTLPTALSASAKLTAYWDFNDFPADGLFASIIPAPFATDAAPNQVKVVHMDGSTAWDPTKVSLKVDNAPVQAKIAKDGGTVTISYVPSPLFAALSSHKASVVFPDAAGNPKSFDWQFAVATYTATLDTLHNYLGLLKDAAKYTPDAGGHTGKAKDYGIDLTISGGRIQVADDNFYTAVNAATANDELTVAVWAKKYDIANASVFWFSSPSQARVCQAHIPWSDNSIYFDTAGCCDTTTQRISAGIDTFSDYTGDVTWWNQWHHFVFSKKADAKQIWIDGKLFLQGSSAGTLSTDINSLIIGAESLTANPLHAVIDDFVVFSKALVEADVKSLFGGTLPTALPASKGLLAYWDFNTLPAVAPVVPTLKLERMANGIVLTFDGSLQSADAIVGPWTDVSGASPMTIAPTGAGKFYRAKR